MPSSLIVCMFTNLYPPAVSGSSTQSSTLARELVRRGCEVVVITARLSPDSPDYEQADGVHVYRLPAVRLPRLPIALNFPWLSYTYTPANVRRVRAIMQKHQPDVLHLHNHMFDMAFSAVRMQRETGKPLVVTLHTVIKHAHGFYNLLLYPADRVFLRHAVIDRCAAVICPDLNMQEYALQAFGCPRTDMIPYGIDLPGSPSPEDVERLRSEFNLAGKRVILSLGHVHAIRNRKDLIEALPAVLKVFPETVLLVVGTVAVTLPGDLARQLGIEQSVIFTGYRPHEEVPAFLALADLEAHWLNQEASEKTSLGIASLESMGAGVPVLTAANEMTHGEGVLRNGENVVLVQPGRPDLLARTIIDLLSDAQCCEQIGGHAKATIARHFSWDSVCRQTMDVYRRVIASR